MKPTKNRYMCPECGKPKMLFDTEAKAQNFIKFNSEEVNCDSFRPYFCKSCGGWHISSKPYKKSYDDRTDKLITAYHNDINLSNINKVINEIIENNIIDVGKYLKDNYSEMFCSKTRNEIVEKVKEIIKMDKKSYSQEELEKIANSLPADVLNMEHNNIEKFIRRKFLYTMKGTDRNQLVKILFKK